MSIKNKNNPVNKFETYLPEFLTLTRQIRGHLIEQGGFTSLDEVLVISGIKKFPQATQAGIMELCELTDEQDIPLVCINGASFNDPHIKLELMELREFPESLQGMLIRAHTSFFIRLALEKTGIRCDGLEIKGMTFLRK